MKCVGAGISGGGPPWAHEVGGRALDPCGQVPAPPAGFSVPNILKYSRKNHIKLAGHLENFYFRGIFLMHGQFRKLTDNTIFAFIYSK